MPCRYYSPEEESEIAYAETSKFKSMLCLVLRTCEAQGTKILLHSPQLEAKCGVTYKEVDEWWEQHKAQDRERERKEAESAEHRRLRASALAKLTAAERRALLEED